MMNHSSDGGVGNTTTRGMGVPTKRQNQTLETLQTTAGGHCITSMDIDENTKNLLRRIRDRARKAKHSDPKVYEAIRMIKQALTKQEHLLKTQFSHPSYQ
jgi:hypothetical protein